MIGGINYIDIKDLNYNSGSGLEDSIQIIYF